MNCPTFRGGGGVNVSVPIIIAGNGTLHCPEELKALAEKANVPVTTTLHGMGVFKSGWSASHERFDGFYQ